MKQIIYSQNRKQNKLLVYMFRISKDTQNKYFKNYGKTNDK